MKAKFNFKNKQIIPEKNKTIKYKNEFNNKNLVNRPNNHLIRKNNKILFNSPFILEKINSRKIKENEENKKKYVIN